MEPNDLSNKIDQAAAQTQRIMTRIMTRIMPASGQRLRLYCLLIILGAVLLYLFWPRPSGRTTGQTWQPTAQAPAIAQLPMIDVPLQTKTIKAMPKRQAMKALDMSEDTPTGDGDTMASETKQIAATADLRPSRGGYTQAAVIDTSTGQTQIVTNEKPLPWFRLGGVTELGVGLGISTRGGEIGAIRVRQDIANIKEITLLAEGQILAGAAIPPEATGMVWAVARPQWFNY